MPTWDQVMDSLKTRTQVAQAVLPTAHMASSTLGMLSTMPLELNALPRIQITLMIMHGLMTSPQVPPTTYNTSAGVWGGGGWSLGAVLLYRFQLDVGRRGTAGWGGGPDGQVGGQEEAGDWR